MSRLTMEALIAATYLNSLVLNDGTMTTGQSMFKIVHHLALAGFHWKILEILGEEEAPAPRKVASRSSARK